MKRRLVALIVFAVLIGGAPLFAATVPSGFSEQVVASGLAQPIAMDFAPDGRIFVTEKQGKVRIIQNSVLLSTPFLTLSVNSDLERGLLGIALDPQFAENGYVYLYYSPPTQPYHNRVSRFTASSTNPNIAIAGSELILLDNIPGEHGFHNAGNLRFAPDGTLFISTGDAMRGAQTAQNPQSLGGKILRIYKDGTIPADNPFVGSTTAHGAVWAYGLRNPFTFDIDTDGTLYINDVGEGSWEEINKGVKGGNYGWPSCEGACTNPNYINPIYAYSHNEGKSISGAAFYNGTQFPAKFQGSYFFADYVNGFIKALGSTNTAQNFATGVPAPVHVRDGKDGALYYLSIQNGTLVRISYGATSPPPPPPPAPEDTEHSIVIHAAGSSAGGSYPAMELFINDNKVQTFASVQGNADAGQFLQFAHAFNELPTRIKVAFPNDYYGGQGQDRNLRVDKIVVDGKTYQAEASTTASTGTWTPTSNCIPGYVQSEWLHCTGHFEFEISPPAPPPNTAPEPMIDLPMESATYRAGDTVQYAGSATDAEDGELPAENFSWTIVFHHDTHTHPFVGPVGGSKSGNFTTLSEHETFENTWYRIHLTVRDSAGSSASVYRDIYTRKDAPPAASSTVTVFAAGTLAGGAYPTLELRIKENVVHTFSNIRGNADDGVFETLTFRATEPVAIGDITLAFVNDFWDPGQNQDRNVRVDKLILDGVEFQTEAQSTFSTGTWSPSSNCSPGNKQSEWLHCSGYFRFAQ